MTKIEFIIKDLHCASCGTKIEERVKKTTGVKDVYLDFISSKLTVLFHSATQIEAQIEGIVSIIKEIEPDLAVEIIKDNIKIDEEKKEEGTKKKSLIRLIFGIGFFVVALILGGESSLRLSLFLISYLLIGGDILVKSFKNILRGQVFDENFLMAIATIGAFLIGEYPEAVAVMLFYKTGETLQDRAIHKSRKSIKALMEIKPDYANILVNGTEERVDPGDVLIGDIIAIKPGERVPLDGILKEGSTFLDTSALTGESLPRQVNIGDEILSGSINLTGLIKVQVSKEFSESTVNRIIELVQNASSKKALTERFITRFARYYTPIIVFLAVALAIIPPLIWQDALWRDWIYRSLVFLVISCPCALVISIPLGFFGGIGGASRNGILIKGGNYLEALNSVSIVVFDKTGTLTKGIFKVTNLSPAKGFSQEELLEAAAWAEGSSNHPIAQSIRAAFGQEINQSLIEEYEELAGYGVRVKVLGREILAGNGELMAKEIIEYTPLEQVGTIVHVAINKVYAGSILVADEIKDDAKVTIQTLRKQGIKKIIMLTGDNLEVGQAVAKELGLDQVYAQLLPEDKVEKVELLLSQKGKKEKLLFVGDGINDAPVLARADIGVAMGGLGSDAAIEAADMVLMTDEPSKIVGALKIAKRTKRVVWQNIIFALGVKILVLSLSTMGLATMWGAVFADVGVALIAIINAMSVLRIRV